MFLGVAGPTVVIGGRIQNPEVRDIAAIAAYALGLDFPETWTGIVPGGLFQGVEAMERHEMDPEDIPVSEQSHIITLSTCIRYHEDQRLLIVAVRDEPEDAARQTGLLDRR